MAASRPSALVAKPQRTPDMKAQDHRAVGQPDIGAQEHRRAAIWPAQPASAGDSGVAADQRNGISPARPRRRAGRGMRCQSVMRRDLACARRLASQSRVRQRSCAVGIAPVWRCSTLARRIVLAVGESGRAGRDVPRASARSQVRHLRRRRAPSISRTSVSTRSFGRRRGGAPPASFDPALMRRCGPGGLARPRRIRQLHHRARGSGRRLTGMLGGISPSSPAR